MLTREKTLTLLGTLATASITAVGLGISDQGWTAIGATLMSSVGLSLTSNIIQSGSLNLKERWLNSGDGLRNHDIQKALGRAFSKALSSVELHYFESEGGRALKDYERDSLRELFTDFREKAEATLPEAVNLIRLDAKIKDYLFTATSESGENLWDLFPANEWLDEYGSEFRDFVRGNLLDQTRLWFAEELKTDSRENNRAWRAFQRMLLEGIYAEVKAVRASQDVIGKDLQKLDEIRDQLDRLQNTIDHRLPDEPFQKALEKAIAGIETTLHGVAQTSKRIDENVEVIRSGVETLIKQQQKEASSRSPFHDEQIAAYQDLWTRLQEIHVKLRVEEVDLIQFTVLLREINSFMLKQSLFISSEDRGLAASYLQALFEFKEALSASGGEDAWDDWVTTLPVPREVIANAKDLRELDAKVTRFHDLLAERCLKIINREQ
jgi:hypothetical protein